MIFLKTFKEIRKKDSDIVGGKGASLGKMTQASIPVPPGFVILTKAFDRFVGDSNLNDEIQVILNSVHPNKISTVENASKQIQKRILESEISKELIDSIYQGFDELRATHVAVRSSATAEDGSESAWAGQLDSFLNVTKDDLLISVKKCWASLFTPRSIFYRFEKKLHHQTISVAVVIQKMVMSEKSGVVFSVHPVTQSSDQLVIEAGYGLGEAIVSGEVTPDRYIVDKTDLVILDKSVHVQKKELKPSLSGRSEWSGLKKEKASSQKCSDDEIVTLAKLILKIEKLYGFPVDVEWAQENGTFFITQSRPITTLSDQASLHVLPGRITHGQKWSLGIRADESLFFYSAKQGKVFKRAFIKESNIKPIETVFVSLKRGKPIRAFNQYQANKLDGALKDRELKNPKMIIEMIDEHDRVFQMIAIYGDRLMKSIEQGNRVQSLLRYKKMMNLYQSASAQGVIIFSLGVLLTDRMSGLERMESILKKHDHWRNSIVFKEEQMGERLFYLLRYFTKEKDLKFSPLVLMRYLTLDEVSHWLNGELSNALLKKIIEQRKKQGFVYLNFEGEDEGVIQDSKVMVAVRDYFLELDNQSRRIRDKSELFGQSVYQSNRVINGRVVVIKDKTELIKKKDKIKNGILVAIQTTPHYIPYMKQARAIVTDEGGLTCHAAIIAREFKKPCIVGTSVATKLLKDGDMVRIDTEQGRVVKVGNKGT